MRPPATHANSASPATDAPHFVPPVVPDLNAPVGRDLTGPVAPDLATPIASNLGAPDLLAPAAADLATEAPLLEHADNSATIYPGYEPDVTPSPVVGGTPRRDLPEPGALDIKERRSWHTWQVIVAAGVALVVGMGINQWAGNGASSPSSTAAGYTPPPPAGSGTTPTTAAVGTGATTSAPTTTPTTAASGKTTKKGAAKAGATTTTAASSTTTTAGTTASTGPLTTLLAPYQSTGNGTSTAFTVGGGTWNIGYDYQCTPAPASGPAFQVFVVAKGGAPGATPAITGTAASGQAVMPQTSTGAQQLVIQSAAGCRWIVKVTGYS
jgi:hypothetical protein